MKIEDATVKAMFDGICELCQEPIHEGDDIVVVEDGSEWVHLQCAKDEGYYG